MNSSIELPRTNRFLSTISYWLDFRILFLFVFLSFLIFIHAFKTHSSIRCGCRHNDTCINSVRTISQYIVNYIGCFPREYRKRIAWFSSPIHLSCISYTILFELNTSSSAYLSHDFSADFAHLTGAKESMHTYTLNDWFVGDECGKTKHKQIARFTVKAILALHKMKLNFGINNRVNDNRLTNTFLNRTFCFFFFKIIHLKYPESFSFFVFSIFRLR